MGCIQSLVKNRGQPVNKVNSRFQYEYIMIWYKLYQKIIQGNILISDFSATIDDRPTEIREESSIVLRYVELSLTILHCHTNLVWNSRMAHKF